MNRLTCILMGIWIFVSVTIGVGEAKTYKIGTFLIPLMVEDADHGVFVELFKEVAKRTGEDFELAVYPTQRTQKLFHDGELDGFFPASDKSAGEKAAKSAPFYSKNNVVFVRKGTPYIYKTAQLEGKKVGLTKGYTYSEDILTNPNITLEYADSDVINMRKLSKERIDAFIVEEQSGLKALVESGVADIVYDPEKPLSGIRIFFAFQATEEGQTIAEKFSKALVDMKANGTFETIMSKAK
jgi:polar amino acid transport system substrate-binding protein